MEKEIIRDNAGNPVSIVLDYKEWLQIEQFLNQKKIDINSSENPFDWYALTESANSILSELIAYVGRERFLELKKDIPDTQRIEKLRQFSSVIKDINRDTENFRNAKRMQLIIDTYGPVLKMINDGKRMV